MLKNYLKITWAVLKRRKFFTFNSLFGISFTLTVLIVVVSFLDHLFAPNYPELQRDKILYVPKAELKDTIIGRTNNGPLSFHFTQILADFSLEKFKSVQHRPGVRRQCLPNLWINSDNA